MYMYLSSNNVVENSNRSLCINPRATKGLNKDIFGKNEIQLEEKPNGKLPAMYKGGWWERMII